MQPDVVELREFYSTAMGRAVRHSLGAAIDAIWPDVKGSDLAGLGYCLPWLDRFEKDAARVVALMPAGQGAIAWPSKSACSVAVVVDEQLPLSDASLDRLLIVHDLEHSESPEETLKEAWRVLAPGGKLLLVAPNRRGLWARFEHTPFGSGRPFSRGQLSGLLGQAMLSPTAWSYALMFPPVRRRAAIRIFSRFEYLGRKLWPAFGGVILVEATKRLYQGLPAAARQQRRVFVPVFLPQGT